MKLVVLSFSILTFTLSANSQTFLHSYSLGNNEHGRYFTDVDSGYLLLNTVFAGLHDAELISVNSNGFSEWQKFYDDGTLNEGFGDFSKTSDGTYVTVRTIPNNSGIDSINVYSIDTAGNIHLRFSVLDTIPVSMKEIIQTSDGGFLLLGSYENNYNFESDIYLTKTDFSGQVIWKRKLFHWSVCSQEVSDLLETPEHSFIFLVYSSYCTMAAGSTAILKTDSAGNLQSVYSEQAYSCESHSNLIVQDGGYIYLENFDSLDVVSRFIMVDTGLNVLWKKTMSSSHPIYTSISNSITNGFYACAIDGNSNYKAMLTRFDNNGDSIYSYSYSGAGNLIPEYIHQLNDGRIGIVGAQTSAASNGNPRQSFFILTDTVGNVLSSSMPETNFTQVSLYPNPANNLISVSGLTQPFSIEVFSADGRLITSKKILRREMVVSGLSRGLYLLRIYDGHHQYNRYFLKE